VTAADLVRDLHERGVKLVADGGTLRCRPKSALSAADLTALRVQGHRVPIHHRRDAGVCCTRQRNAFLDRAESREVPGSTSANAAGFSPDGGSLAFVLSNGTIVRLSFGNFERKVLTTDADLGGGIVWSPAGIIFGRHGALWIVSKKGKDATVKDVEVMALPGGELPVWVTTVFAVFSK
jgi:hypothetical protein